MSEPRKSPSEEIKEYHIRYLRAINNPLRRKILRALKDDKVTIEILQSRIGLDMETLKWHLSVLMYGSCVEKQIEEGETIYKLTLEGKVVDYVER